MISSVVITKLPVSSLTGVPDLASSKSSIEDSSPGGPTSEETLFADLSLSLDMLMPSGPDRIVNPTPEKRTVEVGTSVGFGWKPPRDGGIGGMGIPVG